MTKSPEVIYWTRHGRDTTWNIQRDLQTDLTNEGILDAENAGKLIVDKLAGRPLQIYTNSARRTIQTANVISEVVADKTGVKPEVKIENTYTISKYQGSLLSVDSSRFEGEIHVPLKLANKAFAEQIKAGNYDYKFGDPTVSGIIAYPGLIGEFTDFGESPNDYARRYKEAYQKIYEQRIFGDTPTLFVSHRGTLNGIKMWKENPNQSNSEYLQNVKQKTIDIIPGQIYSL